MDFDEDSVQIRETFYFANPEEKLSAIQVYASHWYGAMLWDLYGERVGQVMVYMCKACLGSSQINSHLLGGGPPGQELLHCQAAVDWKVC